MRLQAKSKMIVNMLQYGTVLGGLAGALAMVILILSSDSFQFWGNTIPINVLEILAIGAFGLIYGGFFGLIAGIYSGLAMSFVTSLFYVDIRSHLGYKITMGLVSVVCTALFLMNSVWHLRLEGMSPPLWNIAMIFLVALAIYASQQVASAYLYDWSLRKQKAYS